MILIVGGTGNLGKQLVKLLLARGEKIRVMTREPSRAQMLLDAGAEVVHGDLRDAQSLAKATLGARVVISSTHALLGARSNSSRLVDDTGQHKLIHAAEDNGVEQFLFVSAMGASAHHAIDFWRTKARIEQFLRSRQLRFTIVRPSAFMQVHAYDLIGKAVVTGKQVVVLGPGTQLKNYVAERDVAELLVRAIDTTAMDGETIEIGGPENLSANQVVEIFERSCGRTARVVHLPMMVPRVLSELMRPVHEGVRRIMLAISAESSQDMTFNPSTFLERYPMKLTSLEEWARDHASLKV